MWRIGCSCGFVGCCFFCWVYFWFIDGSDVVLDWCVVFVLCVSCGYGWVWCLCFFGCCVLFFGEWLINWVFLCRMCLVCCCWDCENKLYRICYYDCLVCFCRFCFVWVWWYEVDLFVFCWLFVRWLWCYCWYWVYCY